MSEARDIISKINEYLYTNYEGIGTTITLGQEFEYFSEFHKFWERYHAQILNPSIDEIKCGAAADALHNIYVRYGSRPFEKLYDTGELSHEEICRIRYFTANQDFRESQKFDSLAKIYSADPSLFDTEFIKDNPGEFLKAIGALNLSQSDKRVKFAAMSAQLLSDLKVEPIDLLKKHDYDLVLLRETLVQNTGAGYGQKKADMFIRDMVIHKIWTKYRNFDRIDVASDINTIKVALRSGILKTEIRLVSSFLDIFCHQYGLIDDATAGAWRRVWEIWQSRYPDESVASPCVIDYLVYRIIGRDFCKESLAIFDCDTFHHKFKWHSSRNQTCQTCYRNDKTKHHATVINKILPCTDNDGHLVISRSKFVSGRDAILPNLKECPFSPVCSPRSPAFTKLNPPKSISILGQTGWITAYTRTDEGGGGLMS
ncbi:MAG: hypothetical protein HRF51_02905 [bacterium]